MHAFALLHSMRPASWPAAGMLDGATGSACHPLRPPYSCAHSLSPTQFCSITVALHPQKGIRLETPQPEE